MKRTVSITRALAGSLLAAFILGASGVSVRAAGEGSSGDTSATQKQGTSDQGMSKRQAKVDINSATKEELSGIPGVSDDAAQKIIDGRPYRAKNDLLKRNILGKREYKKISDRIYAKRMGTGMKKVPSNQGK